MKINFKTVALFAVLFMPLTGCQKEQVETPMEFASQSSTAIKVTYKINGVHYNVILEDETAWNAFLERMLALTREGYEVTVFRGDNMSAHPSKEKVTFTTTNEHEAINWMGVMTNLGYVVTISYDKETGIYTCIAIR